MCCHSVGCGTVILTQSWSGRFFLQVTAVVVGGVLLLAVGRVLRFIGSPLKWWRTNKALRELIRSRVEFILVYQPQTGASKTIVFL
jgi:hypothetical protein